MVQNARLTVEHMKKYLTLTSMKIKHLLQQIFHHLRVKPSDVHQYNERMVSQSVQQRLKAIAHQQLNCYNVVVNYKRRFG